MEKHENELWLELILQVDVYACVPFKRPVASHVRALIHDECVEFRSMRLARNVLLLSLVLCFCYVSGRRNELSR